MRRESGSLWQGIGPGCGEFALVWTLSPLPLGLVSGRLVRVVLSLGI